MKLLVLDSTAKTAACAVWDSERGVVAESFLNNGYTHSRTVMPMIDRTLKDAEITMGEIDGLGVCKGPGSFTGVRIGIATIKGLSYVRNLPCAGVSTLSALSYMGQGFSGLVCPVMDARRQQVYNALFRFEGEKPIRLAPDRALGIAELEAELAAYGEPVLLLGDGAELCAAGFTKVPAVCAPEHLRYLKGGALAKAAAEAFLRNETVPGRELTPCYLRLSQAERERLAKEEGK